MGCKAVVVCQCRVEWLSRWLLMAHWRCTKAFDLSASLPCALAACPPSLFSSRFLAPLSPFLSSLSLFLPRSGFFPTLCPCITARAAVRSFVAVPLFFPEQRIHTYIHVQAFPSIGRFHSLVVYSRLVSAALAPHSPGPTPPLGCFLHPPLGTPGPSPHRLERIARYDLHSSRNKTSTTLLNDKRNRALSVL